MKFRDLHRQYEAMKAEIDDAMASVVESGAFIMGEPVRELEMQLADYVGVRHCITCASGTDALRLALMAWGIGEGAAVFVPDFTFFATAEAVALQGAMPIFVDVDPVTYNIDPEDLVRKYRMVTERGDLRPVAVVAVDLFGLPFDYESVSKFCRDHELYLLEDGAQGFGGICRGRKACSLGDIGTTSFFPSKPLGCYGDGGALFTDDDEWAAKLRSLRQHGRGADKYDNVSVGLNSRLDTLQAAILNVKLRHLDDELRMMDRIAGYYSDHLCGQVITPSVPDGYRSVWAQYTIQHCYRDALARSLAEKGIPTAVYYPRTMSRQAAFANIRYLQEVNPVALRLADTVVSLPMHPYLSEQEQEAIVAAMF